MDSDQHPLEGFTAMMDIRGYEYKDTKKVSLKDMSSLRSEPSDMCKDKGRVRRYTKAENMCVTIWIAGVLKKEYIDVVCQAVKLCNGDQKRVIVIMPFEPKNFSYDAKERIEEENVVLELFTEQEMSFNPFENDLTPKHEIMTSKEKKELYRIYNLDDSKMPIILSSDIIVRYLGVEIGTVLRVTRPSDWRAGNDVVYVLVS